MQRVNQGYRHKAQRVRAAIDAQLGEHLEQVRGGRAGFYFYLTLAHVRTDRGSPFFRFLARTTGRGEFDGPAAAPKPRVIYIPGEFCVHPQGEMVQEGQRQLRLSYGFEEVGPIEAALQWMRAAAEYASAGCQ